MQMNTTVEEISLSERLHCEGYSLHSIFMYVDRFSSFHGEDSFSMYVGRFSSFHGEEVVVCWSFLFFPWGGSGSDWSCC